MTHFPRYRATTPPLISGSGRVRVCRTIPAELLAFCLPQIVPLSEQDADTARGEARIQVLAAQQQAADAASAHTRAEADKTAAERRAAEDRATLERLRAEIEQLRTEHHQELAATRREAADERAALRREATAQLTAVLARFDTTTPTPTDTDTDTPTSGLRDHGEPTE